jgi:hypothetical protein
MCELSGGVVCEEQAYMDGSCGKDTKNTGITSNKRARSSIKAIASPTTKTTSTPSAKTPSPTICTMDYTPVCTTKLCPVVEKTFGNTCMMNANSNARFLHKGECETK